MEEKSVPGGVLFDLDGTLLDTEPLYEEAMGAALKALGYSYSWEIQKLIVGKPETVGSQIILDALGIKDMTPEDLLNHRDVHLLEMFKTTKPRKGVKELVAAIKKAGLKIAIGTSSLSKYFKIKSDANRDLFDLIDAVVCGDDPDIKNGKPAPDIYLKAARLIGVESSKCVVFEDSVSGFKAGKASGAMKVFVSPDVRMPLEPFKEADGIFKEWSDFDLKLIGLE